MLLFSGVIILVCCPPINESVGSDRGIVLLSQYEAILKKVFAFAKGGELVSHCGKKCPISTKGRSFFANSLQVFPILRTRMNDLKSREEELRIGMLFFNEFCSRLDGHFSKVHIDCHEVQRDFCLSVLQFNTVLYDRGTVNYVKMK